LIKTRAGFAPPITKGEEDYPSPYFFITTQQIQHFINCNSRRKEAIGGGDDVRETTGGRRPRS